MPLIINDCITGSFEYPLGWAQWVVRDLATDIELGYLLDTSCWPTLSEALAKINEAHPSTYEVSVRQCVALEELTETAEWPERRSLRIRVNSATAAWLDDPWDCYQLWLHGVPEENWGHAVDYSSLEERGIDVDEFKAFWQALHERAAKLKAKPRILRSIAGSGK